MSVAKPKSSLHKAAKASPAADKSTGRSLTPQTSEPVINGGRGADRCKVPLPERLQHALGPFVTVSIAEARTLMPKMVRSSATGHTYLISNARTADAPSAVLIGLEELNRVVAEPISTRTLGDVLATLPFSGMDLRPLRAAALPGPGLPTAHLPK